MTKKLFPKDFLWGASVSAHQVEGNNHNDWTVWEKANAERLAQDYQQNFQEVSEQIGANIPVWSRFGKYASDPQNYISSIACDHYARYQEDFAILKKLNFTAFRFSIEWSRIEPEEGKINYQEIEHYKKYIDDLLALNIEPVVTLWHWTMPIWFAEKGGFAKKNNVKHFTNFVDLITRELGNRVKFYLTLNEPIVYAVTAYLVGDFPPCQKSIKATFQVVENLIAAHTESYKIIKNNCPHAQVSIAKDNVHEMPDPKTFLNELSAEAFDYLWNCHFLDHIKDEMDFIGLNYYMRVRIDHFKAEVPDKDTKTNDLGWEMYPQGIYFVIKELHERYNKPVLITENGLTDTDDKYRAWFIEESVEALAKCLQEGMQVIGYLHWSLMDNFEWCFGFWPHYGLVEIDREHDLTRKIRSSAKFYADLIKSLTVDA